MKNIKNEKGITLVTLVTTILVMSILTITLTASLKNTQEIKKYNNVKSDILSLEQEVKIYYLKNGSLPVYENEKYDITTESSKFFVPKKDRNPNDSGNYYEINLQLIETKLNKGNLISSEKDLYVVNEKSFTVYYLEGIKLGNDTYYTVQDSFNSGSHTEEYYSKINLPIISGVTMESSNTNSQIAKTGDTIKIKILANYNSSEFTKLPSLKILGNNVQIEWKNNVGTASYVITGNETNLTNKSKISFKLYDYEADSRSGDEITEVTFGKRSLF